MIGVISSAMGAAYARFLSRAFHGVDFVFCSVDFCGVWSCDSALWVNDPDLAEFDFVRGFWDFDGDFGDFVYDFLESVVDEFVVAV